VCDHGPCARQTSFSPSWAHVCLNSFLIWREYMSSDHTLLCETSFQETRSFQFLIDMFHTC
jgi:hypothetical protein